MVLKMYSIYDKKSKIFHPPAFCHNQGHASRVFKSVFKNPDSVFGQYPEDFQVWLIGSYDDQTAKIIPESNPTLVCEGEVLNPPLTEQLHGD